MPWALDMLGERLRLSSFEQSLLLLCAAPELDTRIASLCAKAQDDPQKPFPTFALIGPRQLSETRTSFAALEIELGPDELRWLDLTD